MIASCGLCWDSPDPFEVKRRIKTMGERRDTKKYNYKQISLRMTFEQRTNLQRKATLAGLSVNAYVLASTEKSQVVGINNEQIRELRQLNGWLNRINANLNMIAKVCNYWKERTDFALINVSLSKIRKHVEQVAAEYQA